MSSLDSPEVRQIILKGLKKADRVEDIALIVCEHTGVPWEQACAFIEKVSVENKDDITLSPLLVSLTVGMFLGGVVLLGYAMYVFIHGLYLANREVLDTTMAINEAGGISPLEAMFIGLLCIIGNFKGMAKIWEVVLKKKNIL